jgi:hypothetical protein
MSHFTYTTRYPANWQEESEDAEASSQGRATPRTGHRDRVGTRRIGVRAASRLCNDIPAGAGPDAGNHHTGRALHCYRQIDACGRPPPDNLWLAERGHQVKLPNKPLHRYNFGAVAPLPFRGSCVGMIGYTSTNCLLVEIPANRKERLQLT